MSLALALFAALGSTAHAAESAAPAATPAFDISEAEGLDTPDSKRWRFLKPKRARLPQNPYASTDFTAYTLEAGETKLGLAAITVGVLPRVQIGTVPTLDVLGVYNASAKFNLVRVGPVDLALGGSHYQMPVGDFTGHQSNGSATLSVQVAAPWSIHVTGSYASLGASGTPDLNELPPLVLTATGNPDLSGAQAVVDQATANTPIDASAQTASVRVASDIRLNRRDSIVLQGSAMVWGSVDTGVDPADLPPILGLDQALQAANVEGAVPFSESYVASAAWQFQWKSAELRVGAGVSSVPGAWLLQSTEFAWRFGGKTKREERQLRTAWRQDKRTARRAERREGSPEEIGQRGAKADRTQG